MHHRYDSDVWDDLLDSVRTRENAPEGTRVPRHRSAEHEPAWVDTLRRATRTYGWPLLSVLVLAVITVVVLVRAAVA